MLTRHTYLLPALLSLACVPIAAYESADDESDTGDTSTDGEDDTAEAGTATGGSVDLPHDDDDLDFSESGWEEIRCVVLGADTLGCLGRPIGSEDAWLYVVAECEIQALVDQGLAVDVDVWGADSCRAGESPEHALMSEHRCLRFVQGGYDICYVGDGAWWTQVVADCDAPDADVPAWPAWQCDGAAAQIGEHPFDLVACSAAPGSACVGLVGNEAVLPWPTCWLSALAPALPPVCSE